MNPDETPEEETPTPEETPTSEAPSTDTSPTPATEAHDEDVQPDTSGLNPPEADTAAARATFIGEAAQLVQCMQNDAAALGLEITDLVTLGSIKTADWHIFTH